MRWLNRLSGCLGYIALACGGGGAHVVDASGGGGGGNATTGGTPGANTSGGGGASGAGPIISTGGASHACTNPGFTCKAPPLPTGAPKLTAGTWTNISPPAAPFAPVGK